MSINYDRFYETKARLLGSCLEGHDIWPLLIRSGFRYKLARVSAGVVKYYNQGVKVMTASDFLKEKKDGVLTVYPEEYTPKSDIVVMLSVSQLEGELSYPNMFRRKRMTGFVFSVSDLSHNGRSLTPDIIRLMKVHNATFSTGTGQVTIQSILPKMEVQQETDGTEFIVEKIKDWIKHTNIEINTTLIDQLYNKSPDKLTKLAKYMLGVLDIHRPEAEWLRSEIIGMISSTDKPWPDDQYKVWAENAWLMIDDHLRPEDYTREDFMERWRTEGERGEYLEGLPLEERLKEITNEEVYSFCWWMSDESRGFFVDWRLCLTNDEVISLSRNRSIREHLYTVAITRWKEAN